MAPDKPAVVAAWRVELQRRLEVVLAGQAEATSGTRVDGSHRPANRGERAAVTNQGYLAHAMGLRAEALREALRLLDEVGDGPRDRVVVGALVRVHDGESAWVAVLPGGDATALEVGGVSVRVLSFDAPRVRALAGLGEGDVAELRLPTGRVELEVEAVG